MSNERVLTDDLLDPIGPDQPAGESLRWLPEWDRIKEARQSDDGLETGPWAKKDPKTANWRLVHELSAAMLRSRSKDLQLAMWFTEAGVHLHGFRGLTDGLQTTRELINRFWDAGLYPQMEDGPEDRKGPFEWLNEKLIDSVLRVPITCCATRDRDYSLLDLRDARLVGSEAQCKDPNGDPDPQKKREYDKALARGRVSLDLFEMAIRDTPRSSAEELAADFQAARDEFKNLERVIDEKFGNAAPVLSDFRSALSDLDQEITNILERKRREEPDAPRGLHELNGTDREHDGAGKTGSKITLRLPLMSSHATLGNTSSWTQAENLVRSGEVDAGLAEMVRLAAAETSGRSRFERKLLLAEVCLASRRERLARAILEELAEQIDTHHLDSWESSDMISGVWTRLYEIYKRAGTSDSEEAAKLFGRICRLDPWQALSCSE